MNAVITCKDPSEFVPTVTFTPAVGSGTTVNSSVVIDSITFKKVDVTGAARFIAEQSVPQFSSRWAISSDTPTICTIAENAITGIANGTGIVRISGNKGFSITKKIEFSGTAYSKYVWTGFSGASKSLTLGEPTLNLLSPLKNKNYFSPNYALGDSTVTKNSNCWAAPLNLTGSAISTSLGGSANSGALITPQHWVGVAHWGEGTSNMGPGATLRFAASDGVVHTRTVMRRKYESAKDRITCLLDSPLPATITPFKLAGSGMFDFPNKRAWGMGWQVTQEKFITPVSFDNTQIPTRADILTSRIFWQADFTDFDTGQIDSDHRLFAVGHLLQSGRSGDSGGAIGGYYNSETFLVSLFSSSNAGALYSYAQATELNANIAELDALQGISTGYTVGVLNIT